MRKIIAWIAERLGVRATYHIASRVVVSGKAVNYCDGTVVISPWIHDRNLDDVRAIIGASIGVPGRNVYILSITRIGA